MVFFKLFNFYLIINLLKKLNGCFFFCEEKKTGLVHQFEYFGLGLCGYYVLCVG